ncbi:MAG: hypothetical protein AB7R55_03845, partial [Gemmatimonadales bacterium]
AAQTVSVTNGGTGSLSGLTVGNISYGAGPAGWLGATLSGGTAPATLTLQPTIVGLTAGTYTATVPIQSASAVNSPQSVTVTMTLSGNPVIALTPASRTIWVSVGDPTPVSKTVTVTNSGTGVLSDLTVGTISYGAGASGWLTAALGGTTAPATLTLQSTASASALAPGLYVATVPVQAPVANSPASVSVTLSVSPAGAAVANWRFEGASFLADALGSYPLSTAGSPTPAQIAVPPASGPASAFPATVAGSANTGGASLMGGRFISNSSVTQFFSAEMLVHFRTLSGAFGKIILGFGNANDTPWNLQVRLHPDRGSRIRELVVGGVGSALPGWRANSGFILSAGIDYYLAFAFDPNGTVTFWLRDLTNNGPLLTSTVQHDLAVPLPADTRFTIGDTYVSDFDFESDMIVDEVRLDSRRLKVTDLTIP